MPLVRVSLRQGKSADYKKAIGDGVYQAMLKLLSRNSGLPKEDVFINLVEVAKENWSFGNGIAQYA
jgi:4-oxalocrotonate tautomerase